MGENGRKRVEEIFSFEQIQKEIENLIYHSTSF
jgi:hypothetical protein